MTRITDLSQLDTIAACNEGSEIELVHPTTKEKLGMFVTIVGKDSDAFRDFIAASQDEDRRKAFVAQRRGRVADPKLFAETRAENISLLVNCTTGFRTAEVKPEPMKGIEGVAGGAFLRFGGKELPFNEENATQIYTSLPWVETQVNDGVADLENFIKS